MTSKERARLRGQANGLQPLFQVGKGGISDALIKQTDDALTARELIKIKVLLETSPQKPKEVAACLAEETNSECVGVVGGSMIFYRYNPELHKDEKKGKSR
ncbi:MAG: YhbY family RNA-binding protein [Oscillospiraceae bacterium]|nr:YhbY family RNA-binding protein [Oscillospiraceae bacterium]